MDYRYIDDLATADIAFEATGASLEKVFIAASDATMNVIIENLESIIPKVKRSISLANEDLDMLLFNLLQELLYFKDAEGLLLRIKYIRITTVHGKHLLQGTAEGERIDCDRHEQHVDVKAVTLHQFSLTQSEAGWRAQVILDV